jgi:hypothetical protein
MQAQDTDGMKAAANVTVTVRDNQSPIAKFTVTPDAATTDDLFTVDASECSDKDDPSSALLVRWDWENDGTFDTDWNDAKIATHRYAHDFKTGPTVITLEVKDTGNKVATIQHTIQLSRGTNTAPTAMFTARNEGATIYVDASLSFDAQDPTSALEVRWDWNNDGQYDTQYSKLQKASFRAPKTGQYVIHLQVRDTQGMEDTATDTITIFDL